MTTYADEFESVAAQVAPHLRVVAKSLLERAKTPTDLRLGVMVYYDQQIGQLPSITGNKEEDAKAIAMRALAFDSALRLYEICLLMIHETVQEERSKK